LDFRPLEFNIIRDEIPRNSVDLSESPLGKGAGLFFTDLVAPALYEFLCCPQMRPQTPKGKETFPDSGFDFFAA
jgi:hypothetical protein